MIDRPESDDNGVQLKLISRKMVHSINNKLFVISSYSELLEQSQTDPETLSDLKKIQTAADECQQILMEWREQADELIPDPPGT